MERLDFCVRGIVGRAWRLHLETPSVQATVPMLRGRLGAALKGLSESGTTIASWAASWHPALRVAACAAGGPASPGGRVSPLRAARPAGRRRRRGGVGSRLPQRTGLQRRPFALCEVHPLAGMVGRCVRAGPSRGFARGSLPWPTDDPSGACRLEFLCLRSARLTAVAWSNDQRWPT